MGAAHSKIEDDKGLSLCRERKRFVKQAIDGRCLLADAHVSYVQSLRNTGTALRKFVEPAAPIESSLYTSTSATPEPLALTNIKSVSQISNSSPTLSQHVETGESFSPIPSPLSSGRFHVNHMKVAKNISTTIKEKPPTSETATMQFSSTTSRHGLSQTEENSSVDTPSPRPGTPPWDYFDLFHPIDNQFSFQDIRALNHDFDTADDIKRLREEEGIPELEKEGERGSISERDDDFDSVDDFDQSSNEPLVQMFKNRNVAVEHQMTSELPEMQAVENIFSDTNHQKEEKNLLVNANHEIDETLEMTSSEVATSPVTLPNGNEKEAGAEIKCGPKDFFSCMKEIENLFLRASEAGTEVPRMLEANKVQFRPLFPEEIANRSKASAFFTACFACCKEEAPHPQASATTEAKYLTWHRSISSSSRNQLGATSKDDIEDLNSNIFSSICMNSGSHASTLDRLYAWERKLCDEVKASLKIRKEYDIRCRLLRHQESRGEGNYKIDKTRATVKDLHSRIRVAIHRIDSISKRIEQIRDKELQPQLEELIDSLTRMWAVMLDCHNHQYRIIQLSCNNGNSKVSIRSDSQHQVTVVLELELNFLCSNFTKWITAHKSYLKAINEWLLKCIIPLRQQKSSRRRQQPPFSPRRYIAPPIYVTCRDWLVLLDDLPAQNVSNSIKKLVTSTSHFLPRQDKGHSSSNLLFSFSRKTGQKNELKENFQRNESHVNLSVNYDNLQSDLVAFLDQLKTFAASAVEKYESLQKSVHGARAAFEKMR